MERPRGALTVLVEALGVVGMVLLWAASGLIFVIPLMLLGVHL